MKKKVENKASAEAADAEAEDNALTGEDEEEE